MLRKELVAIGSLWLLHDASGCYRKVLVAAGSCWLLQEVSGYYKKSQEGTGCFKDNKFLVIVLLFLFLKCLGLLLKYSKMSRFTLFWLTKNCRNHAFSQEGDGVQNCLCRKVGPFVEAWLYYITFT